MLILTHEGPGFRSKLMDRDAAIRRARELREDPRYAAVKALESMRSRHPSSRFFVVCVTADEEQRAALLAQFQRERIERAEAEGPQYLWARHPEQPAWYLLALSGDLYLVGAEEPHSCTCRDAGVCRDNGLVCKHVIALQREYGLFLPAEHGQRLRLLAEKLGEPERKPVAVPLAA
jgi:hypothetical protein